MATGSKLFKKALNSTGGRKEFERKFRQYSESVSFLDKNRDELLKKYDGNWVAVYDSQVVAHAEEYSDVLKQLERHNRPIDEVAIKFLSSRKVATLF